MCRIRELQQLLILLLNLLISLVIPPIYLLYEIEFAATGTKQLQSG